jgi:hypothetical protein
MEYRFTLTYNGVDTEVIEPRGWSEFKSEIKRDFKSHGVLFKFTSGTLKLGFADGKSVLDDAFRLEGFDAVVTLTVDRRLDEYYSYENIFVGDAVMQNRGYDENYFNVDFESSSFQQKVINRLKSKVRLDTSIDLDGNPLVGSLPSYTNDWGTIRLNSDYVADYVAGGVSNAKTTFTENTPDTGGGSFYQNLVVNFDGVLQDDLKQYQSITQALSDGQIGSASGLQNFISGIDGYLTVTGDIKYRINGTLTTSVSGDIFIKARWKLRHENSAGTIIGSEQTLHTKTIGGTDPLNYDSGVLEESFTETTISGVNKGDFIFIYLEVEADVAAGGGGDTSDLTNNYELYNSSRYSLSMLKDQETVSVKSYLVYDIISWILYIISGEENNLSSDFLALTEHGALTDGCGGKNVITNGSHLRGIDDALEISLEEVLDSLSAIYGIGWGFEKKYEGGYRMRLELMEHFYSDNQILDLGSPIDIKEGESYTEDTFDDLVFNTAKIGYSKFSSDEDFTGEIDDFLTKSEYSLPLKTITGDYTRTSNLIASGRLIQATFEERANLTKVWKYDNSNFIISVVRDVSNFEPENDENFDTVTGLDDSTTAYNIRHAPVYMLLNQALLVNCALMGKPLDKIIQNTNVEVNKSFAAQFSSSEDCLLSDSQRLLRSAIGNIEIGNNYQGLRLFNPITNNITIALTKTQLDTIVESMEGETPGYISYNDDKGVSKDGYILNIKWNQNEDIAGVETLEKADNYGL